MFIHIYIHTYIFIHMYIYVHVHQAPSTSAVRQARDQASEAAERYSSETRKIGI